MYSHISLSTLLLIYSVSFTIENPTGIIFLRQYTNLQDHHSPLSSQHHLHSYNPSWIIPLQDRLEKSILVILIIYLILTLLSSCGLQEIEPETG